MTAHTLFVLFWIVFGACLLALAVGIALILVICRALTGRWFL